MTKNTLLVLFISLSIAGCNPVVKESITPTANTFYEIFPVLIDTFHFDNRLASYALTNDTLKLDSLARDTTPIVIAIRDTLIPLKKDDYRSLHNHIKGSPKELDSLIEDSLGNIDISKLKSSDKRIRFKSTTSLPTGLEFWKSNYDFYLSAKFSFSNILFNKNKTSGLLHVAYVCGPYQCGEGFLVYLRKEMDGWVIEKIEDRWAM